MLVGGAGSAGVGGGGAVSGFVSGGGVGAGGRVASCFTFLFALLFFPFFLANESLSYDACDFLRKFVFNVACPQHLWNVDS